MNHEPETISPEDDNSHLHHSPFLVFIAEVAGRKVYVDHVGGVLGDVETHD